MNSIKIYRSILEGIREDQSFDARWGDMEKGLITAWESGRKHRFDTFKMYIKPLEDGALPKLSFKGGHIMPFDEEYENKAKYIYKYGTLHYLAQAQGIMGKDLDIDIERDNNSVKICTLTGLKTIFTRDIENYKENKTFNKKVKNDI